MTILTLAFECKDYDINFKLSWIGDLNQFFNSQGYKIDLIELNKQAIATRTLMLTREGLYAL